RIKTRATVGTLCLCQVSSSATGEVWVAALECNKGNTDEQVCQARSKNVAGPAPPARIVAASGRRSNSMRQPMSAKDSSSSPDVVTMDKIVSLCKRRGFIFPSSEIYGGVG